MAPSCMAPSCMAPSYKRSWGTGSVAWRSSSCLDSLPCRRLLARSLRPPSGTEGRRCDEPNLHTKTLPQPGAGIYRSAPGLHLACTWPARGLSLACPWPAPGLHLACTWPVPGLHLACTWPAPGLHLAAKAGCICQTSPPAEHLLIPEGRSIE
eukprot:345864-Chlamydomonas_euryale.AAC.1